MVNKDKQAQKEIINLIHKSGNRLAVSKSKPKLSLDILSDMVEKGFIQIKDENETTITYMLNEHQIKFWFKGNHRGVFYQKDDQLFQAKVISTSPLRIQIEYMDESGKYKMDWVKPHQVFLKKELKKVKSSEKDNENGERSS